MEKIIKKHQALIESTKRLKSKDKEYDISSKNIFSDLGLENPEERLAKAKLARQINILMKQKNLTQVEAAQLLNIDRTKISALNKGKLAGFSIECLSHFFNILSF